MQWEKVAGASRWFTDVSGVGRYLVRWVRTEAQYRAFLNGKPTVYVGSAPDVKKTVEQVVRALEHLERAKEVTVQETGEPGTGNQRLPPPNMKEYAEELYRQAQHYAADKRHIVLTDIYLALESVARKCAELERRVAELEEKDDNDG